MAELFVHTDTINRALRDRFCAPEYALFFEVANGTGSNIRRYADAMAMSLFPSRGLTMHGFEVKVSRSDWLRELKSPDKAEEGNYRYCDFWWIVTAPDIIRPGELPETWGHLEYQPAKSDDVRGQLRQKKAAPKLEAQPMGRSFIAALLRRADEVNTAVIRRAVDEQTRAVYEKLQAVRKDNQAAIDEAVEERTKGHKKLSERVKQFEEATGISFSEYGFDPGEARLIKALKAAGFAATYGGLARLASTLATTAERVRESLTEFDKLAPPEKPGADAA